MHEERLGAVRAAVVQEVAGSHLHEEVAVGIGLRGGGDRRNRDGNDQVAHRVLVGRARLEIGDLLGGHRAGVVQRDIHDVAEGRLLGEAVDDRRRDIGHAVVVEMQAAAVDVAAVGRGVEGQDVGVVIAGVRRGGKVREHDGRQMNGERAPAISRRDEQVGSGGDVGSAGGFVNGAEREIEVGDHGVRQAAAHAQRAVKQVVGIDRPVGIDGAIGEVRPTRAVVERAEDAAVSAHVEHGVRGCGRGREIVRDHVAPVGDDRGEEPRGLLCAQRAATKLAADDGEEIARDIDPPRAGSDESTMWYTPFCVTA